MFEPQAAQATSVEEADLVKKHEIAKKEVITSIRTNFSEVLFILSHH